MEKLILSLAKSLQEGQITNNIIQEGVDIIKVSEMVANLLKDIFLDMGYTDVYPYAIMFNTFINGLTKVNEHAYLIGFKGKSIELSEYKLEELKEFEEKLREIEHRLYDLYMPSSNKFLVPIFEYKTEGMRRREGQYENEFGRKWDSAFIMQIPIVQDQE